MNSKHQQAYDELCRALAAIQTPQEAASFLEDLCTIQEAITLSQRLQVASLLSKGMNYAEITSQTGISSATISRVSRYLNYGSGGYQIVLNRMKEETQ